MIVKPKAVLVDADAIPDVDLDPDTDIVVVSSRPECQRGVIHAIVEAEVGRVDALFMRECGDDRNDDEVISNLVERYVQPNWEIGSSSSPALMRSRNSPNSVGV
jgi:hypothetical protein